MSLFDLSGPEFLFAYALLMLGATVALVVARQLCESGPTPKLPFVDPYLIAYLRGGADETVRVSTFVLLDRGLLESAGERVHSAPGAAEQVRRPLEREIVSSLQIARPGYELVNDPDVLAQAERLSGELMKLGLVPGPSETRLRAAFGLVAVFSLWSVAAVRIALSIERARHNIAFLIMLAVASSVIPLVTLSHTRTVRGDHLLDDLRTLFSDLRERAASLRRGGATQELALLLAVFGLGALQGAQLTLALALFPKLQRSSGAGGGSSGSSSSSCGSSCSSSSSCGGGCGGGCGGCGS